MGLVSNIKKDFVVFQNLITKILFLGVPHTHIYEMGELFWQMKSYLVKMEQIGLLQYQSGFDPAVALEGKWVNVKSS